MICNISRLFIVLIVTISTSSCYKEIDLPDAQLSLRVSDESGKPIEGATARISFEVTGKPDVVGSGGVTDSNGYFTASHNTTGETGFSVEKDGYYRSEGGMNFHSSSGGKWEPWNPAINVVLRKIENPVPMYARDTQMSPLRVPVVGKNIGFDLIDYDWVRPYGKGRHSDLIVNLHRDYKDDRNFYSIITITFSNRHDGIQLVKNNFQYSRLKLPKNAPTTGYVNKIVKHMRYVPDKGLEYDESKEANYIFRIRSEEKNGNPFEAMYGKIRGDILLTQ
jgi:hypothetical protein